MVLKHEMLPSDKGTYSLSLHLVAPARLRVGRLGIFDFPAGWYVYVGTATPTIRAIRLA